MKQNNQIERVTDPTFGPLDGVSLHANAMITLFGKDEGGKTKIDTMEAVECKLMESYEAGTVSVSIPSKGMMVSVRVDEMFALMMAAAVAAKEEEGKREESPSGSPS